MNISKELKKRFVRDFSIPIRIFDDPYFLKRIELFDSEFDTIKKWDMFVKTLDSYNTEEEFFADYNRVKDEAIAFIQNSEGFKRFNSMDMSEFAIPKEFQQLPSKDVFKKNNIGKEFISFDIKKANFNALRKFDLTIFDYAPTWEDFLRKFTDVEYIINSKYIREVIFGNCNPKRITTYEKYLMSKFLTMCNFQIPDIKFYSNDEVIVSGYFWFLDIMDSYTDRVNLFSNMYVPIRTERFVLAPVMQDGKIVGYNRKVFVTDTKTKNDFKCIDAKMYPFVLRALKGEPITDDDLVFDFEGSLAKYLAIPNITL